MNLWNPFFFRVLPVSPRSSMPQTILKEDERSSESFFFYFYLQSFLFFDTRITIKQSCILTLSNIKKTKENEFSFTDI